VIAAVYAVVVKLVYLALLAGGAGDVAAPRSDELVIVQPGAPELSHGVEDTEHVPTGPVAHVAMVPEPAGGTEPAPAEVILPDLPEAPATDSPMCPADIDCWSLADEEPAVTWDRPYGTPVGE
jgi:hypothetical protein